MNTVSPLDCARCYAPWCIPDRGRFEGSLCAGFINMLIVTVGSGVLAPLILREPLPFFSDDRLITFVIIFYLLAIRFDPYVVRIIKIVR